MDAPLLELDKISKAFPGVQALQNVSLTVYPGQIHAVLGENGAGKSTLMKVLNGIYSADAGQIRWQGQPVQIRSPHEAQELGLSMIHQELALIPHLDAAKNIYLGREPRGWLPGTIDWARLYADAQHLLDELDQPLDVRRPVRFFSIAQQQMIEVAKALSRDARVIVMDEPTSSLTDREVETLFEQMRALRARGVAIIFISHRLDEVFRICDWATVLRDGQLVDSQPIEKLTPDDVIRMMVGREVGQIYDVREDAPQERIVLELRGLSRGRVLHDINLKLRAGEILGVAGLVGAGRTELAQTIFGVHPPTSGEILLDGRPLRIRRPSDAIAAGIGLVPEDRKGQGLFLRSSVALNIQIARLGRLLRAALLLDWNAVRRASQESIKQLDIRTPSAQQVTRNLSGGNQQKVVIARWLTLNPRVLILDEPTRGIDVGAKSEIYRLMRRLAAEGVAILMISSELPEVLGVSDRVLVMRGGRIAGEFDPRSATQEDLLHAATGTQRKAQSA